MCTAQNGGDEMKRLPPLTAVEAFVQTARLGSVKAAAESLALSSPALSRRIQSLERHVGRPLFERRHQAVLLNPDGEQLLAEIGPALEELGHAMERASGQAELMRLKLAVLPLFASHRLMPRLGELRRLHPDLHIDIDTRPHALARLDEGLDAAIALAREVDPSLYSVRLGHQPGGRDRRRRRRAALAHPEQLGAGDGAAPPRPARRLRTIGARRSACPTWQPAAIDHFDSGQLILDAAAQGLGVAFMFEMHLEARPRPAPRPPVRRRGREPLFLLVRLPPRRAWAAARSGSSTTGCSKRRRKNRDCPYFGDGPLSQTLIRPMILRIAARVRKRLAWAPTLFLNPGITTALLRSRPSRPARTTASAGPFIRSSVGLCESADVAELAFGRARAEGGDA